MVNATNLWVIQGISQKANVATATRRGTVESVDGSVYVIKNRDGAEVMTTTMRRTAPSTS